MPKLSSLLALKNKNARRIHPPRSLIWNLVSIALNYRLVRPCAAAAALGGCTGCFAASAAASFCASWEGFPLLTSPLAR